MLVVELQANNMSGVVPKSISNCKALEVINLASNQLSGHIPEELACLPALSDVDLSHNNFRGSIPGEFSTAISCSLQSSAAYRNYSFGEKDRMGAKEKEGCLRIHNTDGKCKA
ncbi:hypothetical protein V6N12_072191 [Hibiscus sabdariffa]